MTFLAKSSCTFLFILTLSVIDIYTTIRSHLKHHISATAMKNMYLFILTLSVILIYTTIWSHLNHPIAATVAAMKNLYYRNAFLSSANKYTIAAYLYHLTLHPHLVSTPVTIHTTMYVKAQFEAHGLDTHFANYSTLLSHPKHSSISTQFSNGTMIYLSLFEPNVPQNGVVMPYHAYSPSGTAYGKTVFLNYRP